MLRRLDVIRYVVEHLAGRSRSSSIVAVSGSSSRTRRHRRRSRSAVRAPRRVLVVERLQLQHRPGAVLPYDGEHQRGSAVQGLTVSRQLPTARGSRSPASVERPATAAHPHHGSQPAQPVLRTLAPGLLRCRPSPTVGAPGIVCLGFPRELTRDGRPSPRRDPAAAKDPTACGACVPGCATGVPGCDGADRRVSQSAFTWPAVVFPAALLVFGWFLWRKQRYQVGRWTSVGFWFGLVSSLYVGFFSIVFDQRWIGPVVPVVALAGAFFGALLGQAAQRTVLSPLRRELAGTQYELLLSLRGVLLTTLEIGTTSVTIRARFFASPPGGRDAARRTYKLSEVTGVYPASLTGSERLKFPIRVAGQASRLSRPRAHPPGPWRRLGPAAGRRRRGSRVPQHPSSRSQADCLATIRTVRRRRLRVPCGRFRPSRPASRPRSCRGASSRRSRRGRAGGRARRSRCRRSCVTNPASPWTKTWTSSDGNSSPSTARDQPHRGRRSGAVEPGQLDLAGAAELLLLGLVLDLDEHLRPRTGRQLLDRGADRRQRALVADQQVPTGLRVRQ